jgi:hypothetical protein
LWLSAGTDKRIFTIFVSCGDDVQDLRELVTSLVDDAVNPVLAQMGVGVRLEVDSWWRTSPHRVPEGERGNTQFVERARAANMVLGLLIDDLRPGTQEELEGALDKDSTQVAVIWCVKRGGWPTTPAGDWLGPRRNALYVDQAGPLGTNGPIVSIFRLLLETVFSAAGAQHSEAIRERR